MKKLEIRRPLLNVLRGARSILELIPSRTAPRQITTRYDPNQSPEQQDSNAIQSDWEEVGKDLEYAIKDHSLSE